MQLRVGGACVNPLLAQPPAAAPENGTTMHPDTARQAGDSADGLTDRLAEKSDAMSSDTVPTSFGVFKPVGHVMTGLPTQGQADALLDALRLAGWPPESVMHFKPRESVAELEAMVDNAGPLAGFGYEIKLLRRYLVLAREDYRWLLVKVDDGEQATAAAEAARACGATLAVYYRILTVEELI